MKHTIFSLSILMGILAAPALAQNNGTPYDCYSVYTFTAAGSQTWQSNDSAAAPCNSWRVTYTSTGFSAVIVRFETSPDATSGTAVPNSLCNGSTVQPPCVSDGSNPLATDVMGSSAFRAYGKYVRVKVTSVTGSGTGQVVVYGYKGTSASANIGGSGGGGGSGTVTNTGNLTAAALVSGNDGVDITIPCAGCTLDSSGNQILTGTLDTGSGGGAAGKVNFKGSSTGSAAIQAAAAQGTPNPIQLPTSTGAAGQVASTDGGSPQQLSWINHNLVQTCTVITGDPGSGSSALSDDNDSPVACGNTWGKDWTITSVDCWANAGAPTVTPILTGGNGTSILTGALTCGTAAWAAGTVQGTAPVVHSFGANGTTCSSTPCTIDSNITTAGGTAKYIVVRITGTL